MTTWTRLVRRLFEEGLVKVVDGRVTCARCGEVFSPGERSGSRGLISLYREIYRHFLLKHRSDILLVKEEKPSLALHTVPATILVEKKVPRSGQFTVKIALPRELAGRTVTAIIEVHPSDMEEEPSLRRTLSRLIRRLLLIYPIPLPKLKKMLLKVLQQERLRREITVSEAALMIDQVLRPDLDRAITDIVVAVCQHFPVTRRTLVEIVLDIVAQMKDDGMLPRNLDAMMVVEKLDKILRDLERRGVLVKIGEVYRTT